MPKLKSDELTRPQKRALEMVQNGVSNKEIASKLGVSVKTIGRWKNLPQFKEEKVAPAKKASRGYTEERAAMLRDCNKSGLELVKKVIESEEHSIKTRLYAVSLAAKWAGYDDPEVKALQEMINLLKTLKPRIIEVFEETGYFRILEIISGEE